MRKEDLRRHLSETHRWSYMCADAPLVFVVCGHPDHSDHWVEDTSAATQNLLLATAGLDLGAVWIGIYPRLDREEHVKKTLGIPDEVRVLCLVAAEHPAESKPPRTQYDEDKVHYDGF